MKKVIESKSEVKSETHNPWEITFKGKTYPVSFRHDMEHIRKHKYSGKIFIRGRTIARIKLEDDTVIRGETECSILDQFSKRLGRIISYGRLEKALGLPVGNARKK